MKFTLALLITITVPPLALAEPLGAGAGIENAQVGVTLTPQMLPTQFTERHWVAVPPWAVGQWQRQSTQSSNSCGTQTDAIGTVWQLSATPVVGASKDAATTTVTVVMDEQVDATPAAIRSIQRSIRLVCDSRTMRILKVDNLNDEQTITPVGQDQTRTDFKSGRKKGHYLNDHVGPFNATSRYGPIDCRRSLAEHLHSIDRDDLIPQ